MLELIIAVLPGILALWLYSRTHRGSWSKKALLPVFFYTVTVSFCILIGLRLIGMQNFNLFEMSARFKIKWIILEIVLTLGFHWIISRVRKTPPTVLKQLFQRVFPAALLCSVTYAIFIPSSLFLGNIDEFSISYGSIAPVLFCMAFLFLVAICFPVLWLIRERTMPFYIALIFGVSLCTYLQGSFLNYNLPELDGTWVDWGSYQTENIISTVVWILCGVVIVAAVCLKREKFETAAKYISYFLSAVQMVSLVILILSNPLDDKAGYGFSKEGEFTVGAEDNIIVFVVDTLQADTMETYFSSDSYGRDGTLDDFTFYDNAVAGGAPTAVAVPLLLTGVEYDPSQPYEAYLEEAWEETPLYDDLHQNGYDIRMYSTPGAIAGFSEGTIDNYTAVGSNWIEDHVGFAKSLYQVVNYLIVPQALKQRFWLSTDNLLYHIKSTGYKINDIHFYQDFLAAGETLTPAYEKAFRLYHLRGVHEPHNMTEYFERVCSVAIGEQTVLQGDMKLIYAYIEELKRLGVYEKSTIIILGDHGRHEIGNPESNPAVLIKLPKETHELAVSSAPIHFRNITPTIAGTFREDYAVYGPAVYDITKDSDVERLHTVNKVVRARTELKGYDEASDYSRIIVSGEADAGTYSLWDPKEINRISYKIGDIIDFTEDSGYAEQIDYRLYKENGAATASNELSLCFELDHYENEDLELHFVYSDLYRDPQAIRVYASGEKVENILCTKSDTGKEKMCMIPKEAVKDGILTLRMVFPNAVTPNQLDRSSTDTRILSVVFDSLWLES